jgi:hypothetical protein
MRSAFIEGKERGTLIPGMVTTVGYKWIQALLDSTEDGLFPITVFHTDGDPLHNFLLRIEAGEIEAGTPGPTPREPAG